MKKVDVAIVGGGIVGLTLAALLAQHHFSVAIIESNSFSDQEKKINPRVVALHGMSQKLLRYIDAWEGLDHAPMQKMCVWDHTQNTTLHFDSELINQTEMGFIIENDLLVKNLHTLLIKKNEVIFFHSKPAEFSHSILHLENGEKIQCNLLVGADGAKSWVRALMKINLAERSYHQQSIIAVVESEKPHDRTAFQQFLKTGPVALLPLENQHHSALIWSIDEDKFSDFATQSDDDFSKSLTQALDFKLGKLKIISDRKVFPLIMRHATEYAVENIVLVGDAAHTIHPLAGLGVNLGLMDAACLTDILTRHRKNIGDLKTLRAYTRWRKAENTDVINMMCFLKTIFSVDNGFANVIRSVGMQQVESIDFIKKRLMEIAAGRQGELPSFLQN